MKRNKYKLIVEKTDGTISLELQGGRFVANRIYKYYCKNANRVYNCYCENADITTIKTRAVFLMKNDNVIKQYYID